MPLFYCCCNTHSGLKQRRLIALKFVGQNSEKYLPDRNRGISRAAFPFGDSGETITSPFPAPGATPLPPPFTIFKASNSGLCPFLIIPLGLPLLTLSSLKDFYMGLTRVIQENLPSHALHLVASAESHGGQERSAHTQHPCPPGAQAGAHPLCLLSELSRDCASRSNVFFLANIIGFHSL